MATNLYETLEVSIDATPEQIRKAYKKKALQTHPDRLPPGATPEEKAASEELFRMVNNAYEILNDHQNRRVYDLHGVFPPPEPESTQLPRRSADSRHQTHSGRRYQSGFSDPFFEDRDPFSFAFTDPFSLFESIFGFDTNQSFPHRHHHASPRRTTDPFDMMRSNFDSVFDREFGGGFMGGFMGGFGPSPFGVPARALEATPFSGSSSGNWAGESYMSTSVNGVTQTVRKRRDWEGNEHVTRTFPDGREVYSINGVEQPSPRGYISSPSGHVDDRHYRSTPASASQPRINSRPAASQHPPPYPPPPYPGRSQTGYGINDYSRRRDHRYSESRSDPYNVERPDRDRHDSQHRKRWWPSHRS